MSLTADVVLTLGGLQLRATVHADPGEVVAVLGPNGAGKTTLLRAVAGLTPIEAGSIRLAGRTLEDPAAGIRLPPELRRIGVVFQDHALFPHLSALENVAFGLRAGGMAAAEARRLAAVWLERLGIGDHAGRRPERLSGGEAQRVALARALAPRPDVLLLDEPLAALDAEARRDIRRDLRRRLTALEQPCLLVTHDPIEAAVLADRVVVLERGVVVQDGTIAEITLAPRSPWVAKLVGVNLYRGRGRGHEVALPAGRLVAADPVEGEVFALVPPRSVTLHRRLPEGSARNVFPGVVGHIEAVGDRVRIEVEGDVPIVAEVTPAAIADLDLGRGGAVWATVKASEVDVYPA